MFFLIDSLDTLVRLSSHDNDRLMRPFYRMKLILTDDWRITNCKELLLHLFKTFLHIVSFFVDYKHFSFSFWLLKMELFCNQRCKSNNCNFYHRLSISSKCNNEKGNCILDDKQKKLIPLSARSAK